jgi:hypothetical protein
MPIRSEALDETPTEVLAWYFRPRCVAIKLPYSGYTPGAGRCKKNNPQDLQDQQGTVKECEMDHRTMVPSCFSNPDDWRAEMKGIRLISAGVLLLLFGTAASAYAQHEQGG